MNIKKNGSVWLLATFGGKLPLLTNFCHVFWLCVLSLISLTAVIGLVGWFVGDLIAALVVWFETGVLLGSAELVVFITCFVVVIAAASFAIAYLIRALGSAGVKIIKAVAPSSDSFINTTYRSWKDKYCPTVTEVE